MRITERQLRRIIREAMELDLEVGDVILAGKFKNKRKIVKSIGSDDLGQPTINGMKALNFRIEKLMPKDKWSKKSKEALEFADQVDEAKMKITKRQLRRIITEEIRSLQEASTNPQGLEELLTTLNVTGRNATAVIDSLSTAFYEFEEDAAGMKDEVEVNSGGIQDSSGKAIKWPIATYEEIYNLYREAEKGYKDPYQRGVQA